MSILTTSRRGFLRIATVTTAALATAVIRPRFSFAEAAAEKPLYCFPLLGDVHYDHMSHHDLDWVRKEKPGDERQMLNYSKVTETLTPKLFAEVSAAIKAAPATVPFVVQVGDIVEGLCGSKDLATKQFNEAFGAIDAAGFGVPFLVTKGNHDITGPGNPEAYDDVLLPWLAKQGKQEITGPNGANFVRKHDDDVFVFFDSYKIDLAWLEKALSTNKGRHVFVVVHQPVVPYNARANWLVLGNKNQAADRERLLAMLGHHRAIVLSGHLHKYSCLTRNVSTGPIVQLAVCSVLRNAEEKDAKATLEGVDKYSAQALLDQEPKFGATTLDYRRDLLTAETPAITRFSYADVPGYAMVKVYADRVDADIFVSLSHDRWKTDAIGSPKASA